MTIARRQLIDVESTPFYHVIRRCVHRAYLCGADPETGRNYDHRRDWIVQRLTLLSTVFCLDICAYAVMSNHYHLVVKIDTDTHLALSDQDVVNRWLQAYSGNVYAKKFVNDEPLTEVEQQLLALDIAKWHQRLASISWFMSSLNQYISHKANQEEDRKGVFWDARFKSQALIGEQALLACMMYVDLNPIRAGVTHSLSDSDFTSIQQRINELNESAPSKLVTPALSGSIPLTPLLAFNGHETDPRQAGIPYHFIDYLELIEWTGRAIRDDKPGFIPSSQPSLLNTLNIEPAAWLTSAQQFRRHYSGVCGRWSAMCAMKRKHGGKWSRGKVHSAALHPD